MIVGYSNAAQLDPTNSFCRRGSLELRSMRTRPRGDMHKDDLISRVKLLCVNRV